MTRLLLAWIPAESEELLELPEKPAVLTDEQDRGECGECGAGTSSTGIDSPCIYHKSVLLDVHYNCYCWFKQLSNAPRCSFVHLYCHYLAGL